MLLDPRERRARVFVSDNARVEDPIAWQQQEDLVRPWLPDEKRIFMDKYLAHPKVCTE